MNADGMSEEVWQGQFVQLLALTGWHHLHVRRSIGKGRHWVTATNLTGWPDILAWRHGEMIAVELKSETGTTTSEQREVLGTLKDAGLAVYVWRPSDLEEAKRVLSRRAA